jgi:hypothetical protein
MRGGLLNFLKRMAQTQELVRAGQMAQLQEHRRALLESARNCEPGRLLRAGYRVYSQMDENGIIREISRRIGEGNRIFLEIGAGNGLENNSLFLLIQGWRGVWIEGSARKYWQQKQTSRLPLRRVACTSSNIF